MSLDPFAFDLFGNTALSGFGLSAFPVDGGGDDRFDEEDYSQTPHIPEDTLCKPATVSADEARNFWLEGKRILAKS